MAFITFDAALGALYTSPTSVNSSGDCTGSYQASGGGIGHGFLRTSDGIIITFDPVGALNTGTLPYSINDSDVIAGSYQGSDYVFHGFVRASDGTITSFDPVGSLWTWVYSINNGGTIAGGYLDSLTSHGFLRASDGTITSFDAPVGFGFQTNGSFSLNDSDAATTSIVDLTGTYHGYIRASDGSVTIFDVPGATSTVPWGINSNGDTTGNYIDAESAHHGFVRLADGTILSFDVAGATSTYPKAINSAGVITGYYNDGADHGFVRDAVGIITPFDIPTSSATDPADLNASGVVVGSYADSVEYLTHGFIGVPSPSGVTGTVDAYLQPLFIEGLDARVQQFNVRFISAMGDYSEPLQVTVITSPPDPPTLTLGAKLATHVMLQLTPSNYDSGPFTGQARKDILFTTLQYSHDSAFVTGVLTFSAAGNATEANFVLPDSLSDWYVQGQRSDSFGDGAWGPTLTVPLGNIIDSGFMRGQGSIIPALDNLVTALFTYTATSNAGGGPNTGEIVVSWPNFEIEYADASMQVLVSGSLDSGVTLTSDSGSPINYNLFPKAAPIDGSPVQFDNPSSAPGGWCIPDGSTDLVTAAADVQKDGTVSLGGSNLSFIAIMPAAGGGGGGGGSGGGGGGGHQCIVFGESVMVATRGKTLVEMLVVGDLVLGADPETGREQWNAVESLAFGEADCIALSISGGGSVRLSKSAICPVYDGVVVSKVRAGTVNGRHRMFSSRVSDWQQISGIADLGPQRVVHIKLQPRPWMLVSGVLLHNSIKTQNN